MLAPAGVRYVVVLTALAPEIYGEQSPQQYPVPADLAPALSRQLDLDSVVSGTGITVYANAAWFPERALVPAGKPLAASDATPRSASAHPGSPPGLPLEPYAVPVLPGPAAARSYRGPLRVGELLAALAPAGRWNLVESGGAPVRRWVGDAGVVLRVGHRLADRGRLPVRSPSGRLVAEGEDGPTPATRRRR
jgi:hypothetical protein